LREPHVEGEEGVPVLFGQVRARQADDLHAGLRVAPLAPDGLAPARGQGGQEVVEAAVALIGPVILLVLPRQQSGRGQEPPVAFLRKGDMQP
jgi:hypothetical protein